jgi:hypothetical protein
MNIVYLVFGENLLNYQQAIFSIFTILSHGKEDARIVIVTDSPQHFNVIKDRVRFVEIDSALLETWKGDFGYFWRVKIKALELVAKRFPDTAMLYLDSDTFVFEPLTSLKENLKNGVNVMHTNEGPLNTFTTKTLRKMWRTLQGRTYAGVTITAETCMWNAGVLGIAKENLSNIATALTICDTMCAEKNGSWLIEQFSFSLALGSTSKRIAAEHAIGHYWGNKLEWNTHITNFFLGAFLQNLSVDEQIAAIGKLNHEQIPIILKSSSTRLKLEKLLKSQFPDKKPIFIKKDKG